MKKVLTTIFLFSILSQVCAQQFSDLSFFKNEGFDKAIISYYKVSDKTSSMPKSSLSDALTNPQTTTNLSALDDNEKTLSKKIGEAILTKNETCKLFKIIKKKFTNSYALDTNTDVIINFYANDLIIQNISISLNTKNIKLKKEGCEKVFEEEIEKDPCLFLGQMTEKMEEYVVNILKTKKLMK
ncbi:hypothetical protein [Aquimarina aggregata]|uniref:hypothetical protein n=1 Tax=Aquimarina aggregata TaxID=1642818 RepID=UPI002492F3FD|nr:hypothetical protein [Aquimarina aggregata]